jgi:hypothetical protein
VAEQPARAHLASRGIKLADIAVLTDTHKGNASEYLRGLRVPPMRFCEVVAGLLALPVEACFRIETISVTRPTR